MTAPLDVCLRGAGIVGRTLALLLAGDRLRVGLVDAPAPGPALGDGAADVRAYAMNAASRALLQRVRAWPEEAATPVVGMQVHGDAGGAVQFDAPAASGEALAWIVEASALLQALDRALDYQPQVERLAAPAAAALTVVCEGKASATRAEWGVEWDLQPYPQHALAARLQGTRPHGQVARQWFGQGEILALLPIGQGPQAREVSLVWSLPPGQADRWMSLPAAEFEAKLTEASGQALGSLTLAGERARWPLQRARARTWTGPGWALAGDAAHTVHPLAGQGLNLGLADARVLADVLRAREYRRPLGDPRLLRRYERARQLDTTALQYTTDGLQALFSLPAPGWGWLRNWGMRGFDQIPPLKRWVARQAGGGG